MKSYDWTNMATLPHFWAITNILNLVQQLVTVLLLFCFIHSIIINTSLVTKQIVCIDFVYFSSLEHFRYTNAFHVFGSSYLLVWRPAVLNALIELAWLSFSMLKNVSFNSTSKMWVFIPADITYPQRYLQKASWIRYSILPHRI